MKVVTYNFSIYTNFEEVYKFLILQILAAEPPVVADVNVINVTEPTVPTVDPKHEKATAVKWDECEVVDAVIIGDAIESFLKGSMSDKRVSFRRQHSDRRAKSDG